MAMADALSKPAPAVTRQTATSAVTIEQPSLLEQSLIGQSATIRDALAQLEASDTKICLVADQHRRLLGTVTDGDIRRAILRGDHFDTPVSAVMFTSPRTLRLGEPRSEAIAIMQRESLRHLPVTDFADRIADLLMLDALLQTRPHSNSVVIMAGGKGMRLRPLTTKTPKPMLDVGGRPMLETIVRRCADAGFTDIYLTVHYQAEVIKAYFGDGRELGVRIRYLQEPQPLGTAGPLSLLLPTEEPIVVMNGDILTKVDLAQILAYHADSAAAATMAVREYSIQVPYGIVDLDGHRIAGLREKPQHSHFINAGIYVLSPDAVKLVPRNTRVDMPELFERLRQAGHPTLAYPISEYWVDIGHMDDYLRANDEYAAFF